MEKWKPSGANYEQAQREFHSQRFLCMANIGKSKKRCIIVGAGAAGIAAAVRASLHGMEVVLIEGRRYLGGRARSFTDEVTSDVLDNGQHVAMGCYRALRWVLRQLGTEQLLRPNEPVPIAFAAPDGTRDMFDPYRLPGRAGVASGLLRLQSFSRRERFQILWAGIRAALFHRTHGDTVAELLERYRQSRSVVERFWEPLVLATLNAPSHRADAALLREVLRRAFFGGGTSHYMLVPRAGLSSLWEPLPLWLAERGGMIRLGVHATEVIESSDRVIGVATDEGQEIRGHAVIAAVPPKALERLFPLSSRVRIAVPGLETMPIVSVYLWYSRHLAVPPVVGLWGTTSQWLFDRNYFLTRADASRQRYPGFVEVTISGASDIALKPASEIAAHTDAELRSMFSSVADAELLRWRVIKERAATVLLTPKTARQRLGVTSGITGLLLAGDWTATGLPATLESAAISGIAAADAAAQVL